MGHTASPGTPGKGTEPPTCSPPPLRLGVSDFRTHGSNCFSSIRRIKLVAADVRRLILFRARKVGASLRRLLQFKDSKRERFLSLSDGDKK